MKLANTLHALRHRWVPVFHKLRSSPGEAFDLFWEFARRYFFSLSFISLFGAKFLHLFAHLHSLPPSKFLLWGVTFFFQDVMILLLFRTLAQRVPWRSLAVVGATIVIPISLMMSGMMASNTSFYVVTGAEIHWRQATSFHADAAAMRTLLEGLAGFLVVEGILLTVNWFVAGFIHRMTGGILHVLAWPIRALVERLRPCFHRAYGSVRRQPLPDPEIYEQIAVDDYLDDKSDDGESDHLLHTGTGSTTPTERRRTDTPMRRFVVLGLFGLFLLLRFLRPWAPAYMYLSGTLPLTPFLEGGHRKSPVDTTALPGDYAWLEERSSLHPAPGWDWMPQKGLPGFSDWDKTDRFALHYTPSMDPLQISNRENPVLDSIRPVLEDGSVKIKHVIMLKLESTRGDVFPLKKDSFMWNRIAESHKDKQIPPEIQERLSNLTRTAEWLTGFDAGFEHNDSLHADRKAYGGISARNAHTTGTYTLKSLVGTLCGVTPLVTDFNREYKHHIYQPCLPHVFNALSQQHDITNQTDDFTAWPWHSVWMQSVTETYDNQDKLTPALGYHDKVTKETLEDPSSKHYPVKSEEINYYGYADTELRDYIRDAIDDAEASHTRLFLTHLTGTTHHPWGMPHDEYEEFLGSSWTGHNNDVNRYLNTIGFGDNWIAEIISILEEKGIADETLIVMAGDHGLSLPNDGGVTPYDNPHVGSFHVPIVFAHPKLPPVEVSTPVNSNQIVPTILDLLIESRSLSEGSGRAARDILSLYEGQSMLRPLIQEEDGKQNWQFTVMNTGGTWLAVRSAARPAFRLVIPLVDDLEWRFTDLEKDPIELKPIKHFSLMDMANELDQKYGQDVVDWLRDAAHVTEWWVLDNWHRYRYIPQIKISKDGKISKGKDSGDKDSDDKDSGDTDSEDSEDSKR
ncbi:alkaline-phosphatase-like protein [Aspergillus caelatus]|uniref:Alkaline-phosphatase-like protein n=2 Tax=Aspergillus subgen. Circumdati TaxID=2720871 RepID=A0A5N7AMM5_9EURO|nr:alkaline-phosphatase-like protein [Aspergillus caelatus]KAE8370248.1 alkaline-phosphatase-like protein [Aspergillus caelatus]KAE8420856.1 alkaline-phosphatase-like protein [Aspergillus pseudocaelatus]